jgi:hypothetical protein|tara:strand:- start:1645 stop:1848 length:204 start_codon:yes stop_codon:yes gene_type:complete
MYLKLLGLFKALPESELELKFISNYLGVDLREFKPILDKLIKEGHIEGDNTFKLIGIHKDNYLKYNK